MPHEMPNEMPNEEVVAMFRAAVTKTNDAEEWGREADVKARELEEALVKRELLRRMAPPNWHLLMLDIKVFAFAAFPHATPQSCISHLLRELNEVERTPEQPDEWADCVLLVMHALMHMKRDELVTPAELAGGVNKFVSPFLRKYVADAHAGLDTPSPEWALLRVLWAATLASMSGGFDLHDAVRAKLTVNQGRVWGAPDAEGVSSHVKDEAHNESGGTPLVGRCAAERPPLNNYDEGAFCQLDAGHGGDVHVQTSPWREQWPVT